MSHYEPMTLRNEWDSYSDHFGSLVAQNVSECKKPYILDMATKKRLYLLVIVIRFCPLSQTFAS